MILDEIKKICENKGTIPLDKLNMDSNVGRLKPSKDDKWLGTYLEKSRFDILSESNFKEDILNYIKSFNIEHILNYDLGDYTCDVFFPTHNICFKFLDLFNYSEINVHKKHQLNTFKEFNKNGYRIIQIFEDTWLKKRIIVESRIQNLLGNSATKIYGRKCSIKEINDTSIITEFLNANHLQGAVGSRIKLGLYFEEKLVGLMTFGKLRKNLGQKSNSDNDYEMMRFCTLLNTSILGGASKLFKHFIKLYNPDSITSYADKCWSSLDNVYKKLNINHIHDSEPSYFYIIGTRRKGRFGYRKDVLLEAGYDPNIWTEHTICLDKNIYRIYDCGTSKYLWKKH
jgi:hypothetical protein